MPKESISLDDQTFEEETQNARDTWEMLGAGEGLDIDPDHIAHPRGLTSFATRLAERSAG
ncbi:hypothetical protein [Nonomuraea sp. CA-141351]|uniref:hypothetical protein n=1 Tax=Nonomuraea sp. CA-141351 TaxID=3239996 RepID=UPI003D8E9113